LSKNDTQDFQIHAYDTEEKSIKECSLKSNDYLQVSALTNECLGVFGNELNACNGSKYSQFKI
jgi:hypothetical protein